MRRVAQSARDETRERCAAQRGFTLVEMLVVITIIALIMGIVGPRVLNYLDRVEGQGRQDPDRKLRQRARSVLSRHRPLSERLGRPDRAGAPPRQHRGLERALSEGRHGPPRSVGPPLCLSRARPERRLRHHFLRLGWNRRWHWRRARHHELAALTAAEPSRASPARDRLRARHHRRCSPPSCCRRFRAARRARGSKSYAVETAALLKADRNAAIRNRVQVATEIDAPLRVDPLRRDRPRHPPAGRRALRGDAGGALQPSPGRADHPTSSRPACRAAATIALTRLGIGYRGARQLADRRCRGCSASTSSSKRAGSAGFTLIEVLVALAVVAVSLSAIGSLIAVTVRGARSIGGHLALVETARGDHDRTAGPRRSRARQFLRRSRRPSLARRRAAVQRRLRRPGTDRSGFRRPSWCGCSRPSGPILQLNTVRLRRKRAQ